jgi:serine/threonine protein kinase
MFSEPKKIEKISPKAKDLLHGLLNKDPNKRLTIEQILNHPWLKEDENELNNSKLHLFTKAEMIMLSKTYIDYRKANMEELQENFTISNLKLEKDIKTLKNITTKSFILTPYNSIIDDEEDNIYEEIEDDLDDMNNSKIKLENELISLDNKVKEYNMLYELNNNNEVDNGMLKNSKIHSNTNSLRINDLNENSQVKTESVICFEGEGILNENKKILIKNKKEIDEIKKEEKILDKIEKMGYDKNYVKRCLDDNILCQATAIYFLLMNYDNIK